MRRRLIAAAMVPWMVLLVGCHDRETIPRQNAPGIAIHTIDKGMMGDPPAIMNYAADSLTFEEYKPNRAHVGDTSLVFARQPRVGSQEWEKGFVILYRTYKSPKLPLTVRIFMRPHNAGMLVSAGVDGKFKSVSVGPSNVVADRVVTIDNQHRRLQVRILEIVSAPDVSVPPIQRTGRSIDHIWLEVKTSEMMQ